MSRRLVLAVVVLIAASAVTAFAYQQNQVHKLAQPEAPAQQSAAAAPQQTTPPAATGRIARKQPAANQSEAVSRKLELPDGTFVATLNDAVNAPALSTYWGPFDWSPIIGTERSSAGVDWYKHADGSYSTTQMVCRSDLGGNEAMTAVAHPGPEPVNTAPAR